MTTGHVRYKATVMFPVLGDPVQPDPVRADWPRQDRSKRLPPVTTDGSPWPTFSIVTPSLNQAAYIEDALASVANQGYPGLEHVVADGGSTDGTLEILQGASGVTWESEPDAGQADAVNKGFQKATGEILGWLNADDFYEPGAVHAAADFLARNPDVDVVYGDCLYLYQQTGREELRLVRSRQFDLDFLLNGGCYIHQPATFLRRIALADQRLDEKLRYAMDYDLWVRLARGGRRFAYLPTVLATFRITDASKSGAGLSGFWPEVRGVSRRYGGRFFSPMLQRHLKEGLAGRWPGAYASAKRVFTSLFRRPTPGAG